MPSRPSESVDAVIGIDLAVRYGKRLPVCALVSGVKSRRFVSLRTAKAKPPRGPGNAALIGNPHVAIAYAMKAVEYLRDIEEEFSLKVGRVVIDAPWSHAQEDAIRPAERRLDSMGIPYYRTPSPLAFDRIREERRTSGNLSGANQIWMLAGFELFKAIEGAGIECIETYPFAVWWAYGADATNKSTSEGYAARVKAISVMAGESPGELTSPHIRTLSYGAMHDVVDAMMCASVAALEMNQRTDIGTTDHPFWLPATPRTLNAISK